MINYIYSLYLVSTFIGSAIYIFNIGALSLMNILLPIVLSICVVIFGTKLKDVALNFVQRQLLFCPLACLIVVLAYMLLNGADPTLSMYFFHFVAISWIFLLIDLNLLKTNITKICEYAVIISFLICLIQFLYIYKYIGTTFGISLYKEIWGQYTVTGGFGNPNNQSVVSLLLLIYFGEKLKLEQTNFIRFFILIIIAFVCVLMTLSRLCFLISILYLLHLSFKNNRFRILGGFAFLSFMIYFFIGVDIDKLIDSFYLYYSRIISIFNVAEGVHDGSLSSRFSNYYYIITNLYQSYFGGGFGNYNDFYVNYSSIGKELFENKPHAFLFELILVFGYLFLPIYFFIYLLIYKKFLKKRMVMCIFIGASFVPGSVFLMPCFFVLYYIFVLII